MSSGDTLCLELGLDNIERTRENTSYKTSTSTYRDEQHRGLVCEMPRRKEGIKNGLPAGIERFMSLKGFFGEDKEDNLSYC